MLTHVVSRYGLLSTSSTSKLAAVHVPQNARDIRYQQRTWYVLIEMDQYLKTEHQMVWSAVLMRSERLQTRVFEHE